MPPRPQPPGLVPCPQDQPPAAGRPQRPDPHGAPPPAGDAANPGPDSALPPAGDGRRRVQPAPDRQERDLELARLVTQGRLSPREAAARFGLAIRSVYRIVEQVLPRYGPPEPAGGVRHLRSTVRPRLYRQGLFVRLTDPEDPHWELSPLAPGYPLTVNGIRFPDAAALFQALKFPNQPQVQRRLAALPSGVAAARAAASEAGYRAKWWTRRRVEAMVYTQAVKLSQHPAFSEALTATGDRPIVGVHHPDPYWGTLPEGQSHRGCNVLGRILTELRDALLRHDRDVQQTLAAFLEQVSTEGLAVNGRPVPPLP